MKSIFKDCEAPSSSPSEENETLNKLLDDLLDLAEKTVSQKEEHANIKIEGSNSLFKQPVMKTEVEFDYTRNKKQECANIKKEDPNSLNLFLPGIETEVEFFHNNDDDLTPFNSPIQQPQCTTTWNNPNAYTFMDNNVNAYPVSYVNQSNMVTSELNCNFTVQQSNPHKLQVTNKENSMVRYDPYRMQGRQSNNRSVEIPNFYETQLITSVVSYDNSMSSYPFGYQAKRQSNCINTVNIPPFPYNNGYNGGYHYQQNYSTPQSYVDLPYESERVINMTFYQPYPEYNKIGHDFEYIHPVPSVPTPQKVICNNNIQYPPATQSVPPSHCFPPAVENNKNYFLNEARGDRARRAQTPKHPFGTYNPRRKLQSQARKENHPDFFSNSLPTCSKQRVPASNHCYYTQPSNTFRS